MLVKAKWHVKDDFGWHEAGEVFDTTEDLGDAVEVLEKPAPKKQEPAKEPEKAAEPVKEPEQEPETVPEEKPEEKSEPEEKAEKPAEKPKNANRRRVSK